MVLIFSMRPSKLRMASIASWAVAVHRQRNVFGGHAAGGRILFELEQFGDFLALFGLHLHQDFFCPFIGQVTQKIGSGVGLHFLDNVGGPVGIERFQDRFLHFGFEFFQGAGGDALVQRLEYGFALIGREILHDVGDVGRMEFASRSFEIFSLTRRAGSVSMMSTKSQGISRGGIAQEQGALSAAAGDHAFEQAANRAPGANIHSPDLQDRTILRTIVVKIDVVHAHDLAAVHVNHLLIEQVAAEQQQPFVPVWRTQSAAAVEA
jgi:hypothetical protein